MLVTSPMPYLLLSPLSPSPVPQVADPKKASSIYDFRAKDIDGNLVDLDRWVF